MHPCAIISQRISYVGNIREGSGAPRWWFLVDPDIQVPVQSGMIDYAEAMESFATLRNTTKFLISNFQSMHQGAFQGEMI